VSGEDFPERGHELEHLLLSHAEVDFLKDGFDVPWLRHRLPRSPACRPAVAARKPRQHQDDPRHAPALRVKVSLASLPAEVYEGPWPSGRGLPHQLAFLPVTRPSESKVKRTQPSSASHSLQPNLPGGKKSLSVL
jgi:hypothetical protein